MFENVFYEVSWYFEQKLSKISKKKFFFDFFSNFKNLIWATYCAFGDTPDLLQMEKTQTVHLAKKNWNFIQGLIGKISQMCFGCWQLKRPSQSLDGPEISAISTGALKLVCRCEMMMMEWHLLLFFSILIFSWFLRILDRNSLTPKPAGFQTQNVVGTFNFNQIDPPDIIISLKSIMPFLITFTAYKWSLLKWV